jgi:two-component system phosphate regulon response regulator PhoB
MRPAAATRPYALIVEDEAPLVELIRYNLVKEGYEVATATDGEEALLQIEERQPDLVLLDWMLPKLSGIEVCRRLRGKAETRNLPIIMLTARGEESDRIRGLDTGADDYLTKPFSMSELTARIRAVLRRIRPGWPMTASTTATSSSTASPTASAAPATRSTSGPPSSACSTHLMQHPGRVFSREQLLDAVWGSDVYVEARTVDVHVGRLRKALNVEGGQEDPIRTVRSAGYALNV